MREPIYYQSESDQLQVDLEVVELDSSEGGHYHTIEAYSTFTNRDKKRSWSYTGPEA